MESRGGDLSSEETAGLSGPENLPILKVPWEYPGRISSSGAGGRRGLRGRGRGRAAPWGSVGAEMPAGTGPAAGKGAVSPRTGAGWGRAGFA